MTETCLEVLNDTFEGDILEGGETFDSLRRNTYNLQHNAKNYKCLQCGNFMSNHTKYKFCTGSMIEGTFYNINESQTVLDVKSGGTHEQTFDITKDYERERMKKFVEFLKLYEKRISFFPGRGILLK